MEGGSTRSQCAPAATVLPIVEYCDTLDSVIFSCSVELLLIIGLFVKTSSISAHKKIRYAALGLQVNDKERYFPLNLHDGLRTNTRNRR
jgi:hypothetical protein